MLVLNRRLLESIVIEPAGIKITVVGVMAGGTVRLGIEAPNSQTILRSEILKTHEERRRDAEKRAERKRLYDGK